MHKSDQYNTDRSTTLMVNYTVKINYANSAELEGYGNHEDQAIQTIQLCYPMEIISRAIKNG